MADHAHRALICHDDVAACRAIAVILERSGYTDLAAARSASEAIPAAETLQPDAVVIDLALTGELGLAAIPAFQEAAPGCLVYCLSPFARLRPQARAAGAMCVVDPRDLRHLEDWILLGSDPDHPC